MCCRLRISYMERLTLLEAISEHVRKMNKNSVAFKHVKKLKQAVETINKLEGIELQQQGERQLKPNPGMLVYFFGTGAEKDEKLVRSISPQCERAQLSIASGSPYGLIKFSSEQDAYSFAQQCLLLDQMALYRTTLQGTAERVLFYFETDRELDQLSLFKKLDIADCSSNTTEQPVPGLLVLNEFISEKEEAQIVELVDKQKWTRLSNRKVQHYGFEFKYGVNSIDKDQHERPIPQFLQGLMEQFRQRHISTHEFDQLTINCYDPGDGIPSHFDTHSPFEEVFVSLSVLGDIVMEFENPMREQLEVLLRRRSLTVFSGEARYAWKHAICPRKMDRIDGRTVWRQRRISLTFRTIRRTPCECPYYFYCDSQGYDQDKMKKHNPLLKKYLAMRQPVDIAQLPPQEIELEYVERAYNAFGWTFSNPLHPKMCAFIEEIPSGSIVLDIGCGNGYYLDLISKAGSYHVGLEKCCSMMEETQQHSLQRIMGDAVSLPFRQRIFDAVVMVAVWHHLASVERRQRCLQEIARVLQKDGKALITVMGFELQTIYDKQDILMEFTLPLHRKRPNPPKNAQKPFIANRTSEVYFRYYHLFRLEELQDMVKTIPQLRILSVEEEFGNYYLLLLKL